MSAEAAPDHQTTRVLMVSSQWPTSDQPHVAPFLQQQADSLRALGVHVDVEASQIRRNPFRVPAARRAVRRRLGSGHFDVVHVQFGWSWLLVGATTVPTVVTFYGSDLEGTVGRRGSYTLFGRLLRAVARRAARRARAVIVVSESLARKLPAGIAYRVVPTAVDLRVFEPAPKDEARRELDLPASRRLVLFGGAPGRPEKRFGLAKAVVDRLPAELDAELVTVHAVPRATVRRYMNACDALLLTSVHEGSPTMVKEALACNLPIVSVDVGDVREWIGALDGCHVTSDDDPSTIAVALEDALRRGDEFNGRDTARLADERRLAARVMAIYEQVKQS